jgi:hypothetical protein
LSKNGLEHFHEESRFTQMIYHQKIYFELASQSILGFIGFSVHLRFIF